MAVNLVPASEDFTNTSYWTAWDGLVVTANTHAAPASLGISAGMADTIEDTNGGIVSSLYLGFQEIPVDTLTYCISLFIRKDANTSRFPNIGAQMVNGTTVLGGLSCNTQAGTVAEAGAVVDSGCVDVDATWWRFWFTLTNNLNDDVRIWIEPAQAATLGGSPDGGLINTGIIAIGAAIQVVATPTSAPPDYVPNPDYPSIALTGTALGGIPESALAAGGSTIICTLTGSTFIP